MPIVRLRGYNAKKKIENLLRKADRAESIEAAFSRQHNAKKFLANLYYKGYTYVDLTRSYGPTVENPRGVRKSYFVHARR